MPYVSMLEEIMTEKGFAKGVAHGIGQGIGQGRASMLLRLLQLKFGELPEALREQVTQAGDAELNVWIERILFVNSLEAVFADPD